MSELTKQYLDLLNRYLLHPDSGGIELSPDEEDDYLDKMDALWNRMTQEEVWEVENSCQGISFDSLDSAPLDEKPLDMPASPTYIKCEAYTNFAMCFGLYEEQGAAMIKWKQEHNATHIEPGETHRKTGAIGGAYTYEFTPTSLGTVVNLRCACGEAIDVSDYDNW